MCLNNLKEVDPEIFDIIREETERQHENIELIASENFTSEAVLSAQGSALTNKYAEGYPAARWYGGCENVDKAESLAISRAKELFGAEHVNVQPHSGTQANIAVYLAALEAGDGLMAMDLACGGHLSHGHPLNVSGKFYRIIPYGVSRKTEQLDYEKMAEIALREKPKMIVAGASAYPRTIDFIKFKEIADSVGAMLMVDMAHIAGLVAAGEHPSPVEVSDFVTTTTHKTLRGPRAGMIMCKEKYAKRLDREVFPGNQGGPLMHVIAAKAVAFKEALQPSFKEYQHQIVLNAKALSDELTALGYRIVSGGTDNHLLLVDVVKSRGITGKEAAIVLDKVKITVNKNLIPYDEKSPFVTSGIRLGTPAATTRGMKENDMKKIAGIIDIVLKSPEDETVIAKVRDMVDELIASYPLYPARREAMNLAAK